MIHRLPERILLKAPEGISMVRLFSQQVEEKEFPLPGVRGFNSSFESEVEVPQNLRDVSLHFLIRKEDRPYAKMLLKYDELFKRAQEYLDGYGPPVQITFSDDLSSVNSIKILEEETLTFNQHNQFLVKLRRAVKVYRSISDFAKGQELRKYDIVFCTTAGSANPVIQRNCRFCQVSCS